MPALTNIYDYPDILSIMLVAPKPEYLARYVIQPRFVQDANMTPGQRYQMERYPYLGDDGSLTEAARVRQPMDVIGTSNARGFGKEIVYIEVNEHTGPASSTDVTQPGHMTFAIENLMKSQKQIWDRTQIDPLTTPDFHQSVGSDLLLDDWRRYQDRIYINRLIADGIKYNPDNVADGGTYASGPPKFSVADLNRIGAILRRNNVPVFDDGFYHALIDNQMFLHLLEDTAFGTFVQQGAFYTYSQIMDQTNPYAPPKMPLPGFALDPQKPEQAQMLQGGAANGSLTTRGTFYNQMLPMFNITMPAGFTFLNFRIFVTNNIPTSKVTLNYTASTDSVKHPTGSASRTAYNGLFFGKDVLGEIYGGDPMDGVPVKVKRSMNDDYQRFLILIWQAFFGITTLNNNFVVNARTYAD
jgi:hypothetical protein